MLVICKFDWALMEMEMLALPEFTFNKRFEISSVPAHVTLMMTGFCDKVPVAIVTRKSTCKLPLTAIKDEPLLDNPEAPLNDKVVMTLFTTAAVAGFDNETRTTRFIPAT